MQSIADYLTGLVCSVLSFLAVPTFMVLLLRMAVPIVGEPMWRAYCQFLAFLIVAPVRLIRWLAQEAFGRGR